MVFSHHELKFLINVGLESGSLSNISNITNMNCYLPPPGTEKSKLELGRESNLGCIKCVHYKSHESFCQIKKDSARKYTLSQTNYHRLLSRAKDRQWR